MRNRSTSFWRPLIVAPIPTAGLALARWLLGGRVDTASVVQTGLLAVSVLLVADVCRPRPEQMPRVRLPIPFVVTLALLVVALLVLGITENTLSAWCAVGCFYALLLGLVTGAVPASSRGRRAAVEVSATVIAAAVPATTRQIMTKFSSEEFLVIVELFTLALFWILLRLSFRLISTKEQKFAAHEIPVTRRAVALSIVIFLFIFGWYTVREYQQSFFPSTADGFQDISETSPFLCEAIPRGKTTYDANEVFQRLLDRVAENPEKKSTEYGMLTLATSRVDWAELFRMSLLEEAHENLFTNDDWSVKYGQYLAAQRVYYYANVCRVFPHLFNRAQDHRIRNWFAAINRRAMTVGPVDLLYSLAFANRPGGPYENQETGAGLLSLLEANGYSDRSLTAENRQYLARHQRGWSTGFRVTDDSAAYQPEWIESAWYQSLFSGRANAPNLARSFEWLKLLAPPNGGPLAFNHRAVSPIADISWLAAVLTGNRDYIWLAGRALDHLRATGGVLTAQPGAEVPLAGEAMSPTTGSCLLFGPTGLPTRAGPFAADKIVLRGGWESDDLYLLLNLRFTGWHRYKATNSVIHISQGGPLVIENVDQPPSGWLPVGRRLFRDKRIPRENLNGLIIGKRGLNEVLYRLTGVEGAWAQDPPHLARISRFDPGQEYDVITSHIDNWHGWNHDRSIFFYPAGVIIIVDNAAGPKREEGALVWHFTGSDLTHNGRIQLRSKDDPNGSAEVVFLPLSDIRVDFEDIFTDNRNEILRVQLDRIGNENLKIATIFLTKNWAGADASVMDSVIEIRQENATIRVPINQVSP